MGEAARQRVCREYSLAPQLEKIDAAYRQLLASKE
jgi:hypothetical protein